MKALFSVASTVPFARIVREQRRWLVPLLTVIAFNIGVLLAVVMPMSRSVESGERGAAVAARSLTEATADLQDAQATTDLDTFYREVLPSDLATARRITHLKLSQMAREHDVAFERSKSTPEAQKNSDLERLQVSYELSGNWDAIRQFIYRIETGREFVVIDNVVLAEGSDSSAPLSLTLELSTYYRVGGHDR